MHNERWIPVEERLPEEMTWFYATCSSPGRDNWVIDGFYTSDHAGTPWGNIPILVEGKAKVIAWKPRIWPEPYDPEKDTEIGEPDNADRKSGE